jgi:hypothetical protein
MVSSETLPEETRSAGLCIPIFQIEASVIASLVSANQLHAMGVRIDVQSDTTNRQSPNRLNRSVGAICWMTVSAISLKDHE